MKSWLPMLAALGAIAAVGGGLVVVSGVVPIAASSGHWAITEWFLQFAKMRSVATHSLGIELPPLDDKALVLRGAKHYESGCRPCHGSPDHKHPTLAGAMLPPPPYLPERVAEFAPEELFYIVKHGIKFTGMPSWPAQGRDDEVQAIVAFLLVFPKLDEAGYRALTGRGASAADGCRRCHADDGSTGEEGAFPSLAGQRVEYLVNALDAYARGARPSGFMQPIAAAMSSAGMRKAAEHYAGLSASAAPSASSAAPEQIDRGRVIASVGVPEQNVPACSECHGPRPKRRNAAYPKLAGQHAWYMVQQLELFRARLRGGSKYAHLMDKVAPRLTDAQMRDVAAYYASLASSDE